MKKKLVIVFGLFLLLSFGVLLFTPLGSKISEAADLIFVFPDDDVRWVSSRIEYDIVTSKEGFPSFERKWCIRAYGEVGLVWQPTNSLCWVGDVPSVGYDSLQSLFLNNERLDIVAYQPQSKTLRDTNWIDRDLSPGIYEIDFEDFGVPYDAHAVHIRINTWVPSDNLSDILKIRTLISDYDGHDYHYVLRASPSKVGEPIYDNVTLPVDKSGAKAWIEVSGPSTWPFVTILVTGYDEPIGNQHIVGP